MVAAGIVMLYAGICSYGDFIQGIQTIRSQVVTVGEYLAEKAHNSLGSNQPAPTVKKRSGALGKLQRLFERVQRREITVDEAIREAEIIIGDEVVAAPEFMERLNDSLKMVQKYPEQFILPLNGFDEEPIPAEKTKNQIPRQPRPIPALPPSNQLRVEIWRDSKRGKKKFRVTEL
jgi:hypothetical protein